MRGYKIYLIRNGLTDGAIEGRYIGHTDELLNEQGKKQLKELSETGYYPEVEAIFCSPLKRCLETAKIIYPEKEAIPFKDIMECDFGEFEGMSADELVKEEEFNNWLKGGSDARPPFGESNGEFSTRVCNGFIKIVEGLLKTGTREAAIVTHGGVIMSILAAFGLPEAPMTAWRCPSGCGYTLSLNASIWSRLRKVEVIDEIPYTIKEETDDWFSDGADFFWHGTDEIEN